MKRDTFDVTTSEGKKAVDGWTLTEHFATHRGSRDWKLTHLPTGRRVGPDFRLRQDCLHLAEFLEAGLPIWATWKFATMDGFTSDHKDACNAARSRMAYDNKYMRYEWTTND